MVTSIYYCLKNRNAIVIFVTPADSSTIIDGKKTSPFAFALQQKVWSSTGMEPLIISRSHDYRADYNVSFSISEILSLGYRLRKANGVWNLILKLLRPTIVFAIDWDWSLNEVCNISKVPIYYIQHGVIAEDHMYFGRNIIVDTDKKGLPTGFLCWDEESTLNFRNIIEAYNIGNLWNLNFIQRDSNAYTIIKYLPPLLKTNNKPLILVTLTWGNPEFIHLPQNIIEVIKKTYQRFNWIIRLHPVINQSEILVKEFDAFLKNSFNPEEIKSLIWDSVSELPLPMLLSKSSCHITIESSAVIEAAQFGVESLILNPNIIKNGPKGAGVSIIFGGPTYFRKERECGYATIYEPKLVIEDWIDNAISVNKIPLIDIELHKKEWDTFCMTLKNKIA